MNAERFSARVSLKLTLILVLLSSLSASGQIYSVNALAYTDIDFVAGSNLVANPFNAGNNTISNLFRGVPDGTVFLSWSYETNFAPSNRFSAATGWTYPSAMLISPNGGFLWLPSAKRVSFAGELAWSSVTNRTGGIHWTVSDHFPEIWPPPICASITDPCPAGAIPDNTLFYKWNRAQQRYDVYLYIANAGYEPSVWFDEGGNPVNVQLDPGEAGLFWVPDFDPIRFWMRTGPARTEAALSTIGCQGTNFTIQFAAPASSTFTVLRSSNLNSKTWVVVQSGSSTSAVATLNLDASGSDTAFYRVSPPLGTHIQLSNPSRNGSTFQFELYAPASATYSVLRKQNLSDSFAVAKTFFVQSNLVVTVTDTNAATRGYYIVRQETSLGSGFQ